MVKIVDRNGERHDVSLENVVVFLCGLAAGFVVVGVVAAIIVFNLIH